MGFEKNQRISKIGIASLSLIRTIKLKKEERKYLENFVRKGTKKARAIARANFLLLLDEKREVNEVAATLKVHRQRIWRIKKRYLKEGLYWLSTSWLFF